MHVLSREEITAALAKSQRWGVNDQPELEVMLDYLTALPVTRVLAEDDGLQFDVARPLTAGEAFALARLCEDYPDNIEDHQTHFVLWWD